MPWISLVLISHPSRPTIQHFCAMWITRSGTIVIWGKWDAPSPTLPLHSYHSFSVKCMWIWLPKWTTQPFATELPCHLPFTVLLYVAMKPNGLSPLQPQLPCSNFQYFSKCDSQSNGSMTTALIATCTIYICDSHAACIFHSITYRNFRSLFSFAGHHCTCGHFNFCDLQLRLKSLLVNLIPPATFLSLLLPISIHPQIFFGSAD